jgi:hypothetical protein
MNVRNITPVDSNVNLAARKMPIQRIKFAKDIHNQELPVDGYVREEIAKHKGVINSVAELYDRAVTIAQRNDSIFVNSGTITSVIDKKDITGRNDFLHCIIDNIRANGDVTRRGLSTLA